MRRGRVDLLYSLEGDSDQERQLHFDWELFQHYLQIRKSLNKIMVFHRELTMGDLLARDDLWSIDESEQDLEQLTPPCFSPSK